jgi:hypothetical protein
MTLASLTTGAATGVPPSIRNGWPSGRLSRRLSIRRYCQDVESGEVGDGGGRAEAVGARLCPAKMKVSLDLIMEASLTGSIETVKALSAMARDAFIRSCT